jgi:predicted nucleotidyltransferase
MAGKPRIIDRALTVAELSVRKRNRKRDQFDAMREALRPFAEIGARVTDNDVELVPFWDVEIPPAHFRAAARAMSPK